MCARVHVSVCEYISIQVKGLHMKFEDKYLSLIYIHYVYQWKKTF